MHTILVLWRVYVDPLFMEMTPEHQNVLLWAALLHNIAKRGSPFIRGRDHCFAFKSALHSIDFLRGLHSATTSEKHDFAWSQVKRLLDESVQPLPEIWREDFRHGRPVVTVMNSHHNMSEVFYYLWR